MLKKSLIDRMIGLGDRIDRQEVHRMLRLLADERDFLKGVFDTLNEGVLVIEGTGRITFMNRAARHLLGLRASQDSFDTLEHCFADPHLAAALRDAHERGTRLREMELMTGQRSDRALLVNAAPMAPQAPRESESPATVVLLTDITARKEDEARLRRAEHLASLTTVFAGLAHEIRNPLNSLGIHLQLACRALHAMSADVDTAKPSQHLEIVAGEVERLNQVVERFLQAVKEKPLELTHVDLADLVTETIRVLQPTLEAEEVTVDFRHEADGAVLMGDREDLRIALMNLCRNAIEAMPGGGELTLVLSVDHDTITLCIRDTGVGIREEDLSRIFDPYFTTRAEGTGLGLMIVNRAVKEHGGAIEVRSQLGLGTEFVLTFPRYRGQPRLLSMTEPSSGVRAAS